MTTEPGRFNKVYDGGVSPYGPSLISSRMVWMHTGVITAARFTPCVAAEVFQRYHISIEENIWISSKVMQFVLVHLADGKCQDVGNVLFLVNKLSSCHH